MEPLRGAQRDLRRVAERLCGVDSFEPTMAESCLTDPVWLSESQLIAHSRMGDGYFLRPFLLDIKTERVTDLPQLERRIQNTKSSWRFSSDKRWILYLQGWQRGFSMVVLSRDGRQMQTWKVPEPLEQCEYFWIPGTHRWMQLWSGEDSPDDFRVARLFEIGRKTPLWERRLPSLPACRFVGYSPQGEALMVVSYNAAQTGYIDLTALNLSDVRRVSHTKVRVGRGESIEGYEIALSPDGQQLAFLRNHAIWTVRRDGRDLHHWGDVPQDDYSLSLAGWQPGTNRLTFHYYDPNDKHKKGTLYRLPYRGQS